MKPDGFIAGDWGISFLRLFLCDPDGRIVGRASGPGIKDVTDFDAAFADAVALLPRHRPPLPVFFAGMVGSSLGWKETAYVPCPVGWSALAREASCFDAAGYRICIASGVSCVNRFGLPDVMRGEETQLLGWYRQSEGIAGRNVICLPGTHAKWTIASDAGIEQFETSVQGELFDLLRRHSVLVGQPPASDEENEEVFRSAVALMRDSPGLALSEALFSVRSRQLMGELDASDVLSYMSGIVIGADVRDIGVPLLSMVGGETELQVIGTGPLCNLYSAACSEFGITNRCEEGTHAVIHGLDAIRRVVLAA